jgi:hypothetical protein
MAETTEDQSKNEWHAPKLTVLGEAGDLTGLDGGTTSDADGSSTLVTVS